MWFSFLPVLLVLAEQDFGELGNVRREVGQGEADTEAENYAGRGVPYFQFRVPAKQEHYYGEKREGYRGSQVITPFPC